MTKKLDYSQWKFVQMKQLVKEKDIIVQRMRQQTQIVREKGRDQIENIQRQLVGTNQNTLKQCRQISELMKMRLDGKEQECVDLIQYQSEFREEYKRLCDDREKLASQFQTVDTELRCALESLDKERKQAFDFKNRIQ